MKTNAVMQRLAIVMLAVIDSYYQFSYYTGCNDEPASRHTRHAGTYLIPHGRALFVDDELRGAHPLGHVALAVDALDGVDGLVGQLREEVEVGKEI